MSNPRGKTILSATALLTLVLSIEAGTTAKAQAAPPNIVIILTDDQRWDTLRRMPQLQDLLVDRGIRYPNAMVPTSLCCPSRASVLRGQYAPLDRRLVEPSALRRVGGVRGERW